tara:strand:+ start:109 stop:1989 length:1881 start_codon:yes stop_codon:yes gene_type:complete
MQINKGEKNMTNKITGDAEGLSYILQGYKNTMPADQFLREVNKNAEEAIQRVQKKDVNHEGIIIFKKDDQYYSKNKISKMCIIDNGDGMSFSFLNDYMLKLGASTRNNKHRNWGAGFKISGLPFNDYGIIICSWTKNTPQGYGIWVYYNKTTSCYEYKLVNNSKVFKISNDSKPKEITNHGTKITFLGDNKNHSTMEINSLLKKSGLFKGARTGKHNWVVSYLNTKKYKTEKNIITKCHTGESFRAINGHFNNLKTNSIDSGSVRLSKAVMDWFLLPAGKNRHTKNSLNTYALTVGQFGLVHEDEVLKVDFAGKSDRNPLAAWGHQYSKYRVALILKPDENEFKPNLERTGVFKEGVQVDDFFDNWKEEWQNNTPEPLIKLEKEMAEQAAEKINDYDNELKKYASLFRSDQYMVSFDGDSNVEKGKTFKTGGNKNILGEDKSDSDSDSGPNPDKEYGEIEHELGIKIDKSENKGILTKNNPYPNVGFVEEGTDSLIASYDYDNNTININKDSLQIHQLIEYRVKKDKINNYEIVKERLLSILSFQIKQQVAQVYNLMNWDRERVEKALSAESLTACFANKTMILEELDKKLKAMKSVVLPENKWNHKSEHNFHIKNNPNRYSVLLK